MDQHKWLHAIKKGNKKYIYDIAETYYTDVYRFCAFQTGSREDAYDLTQETFLRFIRYVENYRENVFMDPGAPLWKEVVILYLGCWLAVLVLTGVVMAVSALCRRSFGSLIWSIGLYFGPYIVVRVLLNQLSVSRFFMWVQVVVYGLPFSYGLMWLNAPTILGLMMTGVEVVVGGIGAVLSVRGWCRHQVEE